jgi:hypothetical protein
VLDYLAENAFRRGDGFRKENGIGLSKISASRYAWATAIWVIGAANDIPSDINRDRSAMTLMNGNIGSKQAIIRARRGQGLFKERVMAIESRCRITLVENPVHLIASHCKPWRDSTNEERLNCENGLLLTPNIDHLFDRGFIGFEDSGKLIISPVAHRPSLARMVSKLSEWSTSAASAKDNGGSWISIGTVFCFERYGRAPTIGDTATCPGTVPSFCVAPM